MFLLPASIRAVITVFRHIAVALPRPLGYHAGMTRIPDVTLDCEGLLCPLPVLRARKALVAMSPGQILRLTATDRMAAIDLPHFGSTGGPLLLERGRYPRATVDALQARGHRVSETEMTSGLQVLQRGRDGWLGGADPRREGIVAGD